MPPSPRDWLPEDHLVYFLLDLVDELNLHPILATSGGVTRGTTPYHPQLLVKVLLYAYAMGIRPRGRLPGHCRKLWPFGCWRRTSGWISGPSVIWRQAAFCN